MLRISPLIARHRRRRPVRAIARFCERFLDAYHNVNYSIDLNGEEFVLRRLSPFQLRTVFDVGANVGTWALTAARHLPSATIYCFEVAPPTFSRLQDHVSGERRIRAHNVGLGREDGELRFRYSPSFHEGTTASDYPLGTDCQVFTGEIRRGDDFAREHGVDRIDLLKIDAEGMESQILDGFAGMIAKHAIDAIQFEYGRVNVLTGDLLHSFYERLSAAGYVLGKVYPTYVDFRPFEMSDEDFRGPNFLAVSDRRPEMLRALGPG